MTKRYDFAPILAKWLILSNSESNADSIPQNVALLEAARSQVEDLKETGSLN